MKEITMKEITKAQEEILKVLWEIKEGAVSDVIKQIPEPKPAYSTVSTVITVLESKGYVSHKVFGKTHVYFPVITKKEYAKYFFQGSLSNFFNNSLSNVISFFSKQKEKVSLQELEELRNMIDEEIKKQKNNQ